MSMIPSIFPEPRSLKVVEGTLLRPCSFSFQIKEKDFHKAFSFFQKDLNCLGGSKSPTLTISKFNHSSPEAYSLKILPSEILLQANQADGIFRGIHTLLQILESPFCKESIPCLEIEDSPSLKKRGFMLDLSRCKVPTMESLFELVDLLSCLHYNELQLYIEHTFAFADHKTVWRDASPLTGEEIQLIDQYCRDRFIELIPNLNSFGHFERWLKHEPYKHLAECPDGFRREEPFMERDHGSTLKPNQRSLDFVDTLYQEYLPHFSSNQFNVGMDEPWELGQGWSRTRVEGRGRDQVYLEHLDGIRKLVEKHGKKMQFWADVLLEKPENAKLLPDSASPVIWGYEADHPFDEQAMAISKSGLSYRIAPGTATWRSFSGRWPTAQANLKSAVKNAREHRAEGILLTSWGDCGNHQPWPILYPPLFLAAQLAWSGKECEPKVFSSAVDRRLFGEAESGCCDWMLEFGSLDQVISSEIHNASLTWNLLFSSQPEILPKFVKDNFSENSLKDGIQYLSNLENQFSEVSKTSGSQKVREELSIGLELSKIALGKGLNFLSENYQKQNIPADLTDRFEASWLARARPGGLSESLLLLKSALFPGQNPT